MTTSDPQDMSHWEARAQRIRERMATVVAQRDAWKRRALTAEAAVRELQVELDHARKRQGRP